MIPEKHGIKDCFKFIPGERFHNINRPLAQYNLSCKDTYKIYNHIIMHDQEPLNDAFVYTYKQFIKVSEKMSDQQMQNFSDQYLAMRIFRSFKPNILCHSELNSLDIAALKDFWFIDCYYWYHAMIARDWFRHWEWDADLMQPVHKQDMGYKFLLYARGKDGTRSYRNQLLDALKPLQSQILFDWEQQKHISSDASASIDVHDAIQSTIHIVAETLFDTEKIHLTEKIFKPMVMNQPFILLAGPNALKYLRHYGFQTFNQFWDEGYDEETDSNTRLQMVIQLIQKLSLLSERKLQEMYRNMIPILTHNRKRFYSAEFQNFVIQEMFANFNQALAQQTDFDLPPGGQAAYCFDYTLKINGPNIDVLGWTLLHDTELDEIPKMLNHYPRIKKWVQNYRFKLITPDQLSSRFASFSC